MKSQLGKSNLAQENPKSVHRGYRTFRTKNTPDEELNPLHYENLFPFWQFLDRTPIFHKKGPEVHISSIVI